MVFYPTMLFAVVIFIFSDKFSGFLFDTPEYSAQVRIISVFIPFLVLNSILEGYLRGLKVIKIYVKVIIISNLVNLLIIIPLVWKYGLTGGLIGLLSAYTIYVCVCSYQLLKNQLIGRLDFKKTFDRFLFKKILRVSFVFLISGALFQLTLLLLRRIIIDEMGIYYNGIYQSVIGISMNYFGFIFLSLSTYSFPTISKMSENEEIVNELNVNIKYIVFLMVPLIIMVFVFRSQVISILFSHEFMVSENLFGLQFSGDYFKALAWATGIWLVPKLKLKQFLYLELVLNANLVLISLIFLNIFGAKLEYISAAYLIAYIIHFILNYYVSKNILGFRIQKQNLKLLVLSFIVLASVMFVSDYNKLFGYLIVLPSLLLWLKISVKKSELIEIKNFVFSKFGK